MHYLWTYILHKLFTDYSELNAFGNAQGGTLLPPHPHKHNHTDGFQQDKVWSHRHL